ncbi:MAG: GCN5-related N-acetyltransferase [Sphingomonas bacterium]|uniref:GNAT family N-acetyltransferase n=1 Tax=Sphingomonas bacterium TaxID=1895847 RepID=UPI0026133569|nr:GNAT family N-acetyltransferase [Sphingomonas bacterium]MDB5708893.1 GCN5-related N-acetyltransferase [Sphingomonas bacterium]
MTSTSHDDTASFALTPATMADILQPSPRLLAGLDLGFPDRKSGTEALRDVMTQFEAIPRPVRWGPYWSVDLVADAVVGLCGFKDVPTDDSVEIAYFTFPCFEGCGYATRTIGQLTALAWSDAALVIAHTLPVANASNTALARHGFTHAGEMIDPDDGLVWRWEKSRPA